MRISSSHGISIGAEFRANHERAAPPREADGLSSGKSLVPVESMVTAEDRHVRLPRALAAFVTQLIAREQGAAHTRVRRRAEPAEAARTYRKMLNIGGVPNRNKARPF